MARVGLVVNPIAGMGGRVGLHGTDGDLIHEAIRRGATPQAAQRATQALIAIKSAMRQSIELVVPEGELGLRSANDAAFTATVIHRAGDGPTNAATTRQAVEQFRDMGVDLIMFAGGDGTARDVVSVVGDRIPVLGIPTGVKMRSAVFARGPVQAGDVAAAFLNGRTKTQAAEVVDVVSTGSWDQQIFGICQVPVGESRMQAMKGGPVAGSTAVLSRLQRHLADNFQADHLYLLGPGITTAGIAAHLGLQTSRIGVDAVLNGQLVGSDLSESQIDSLLGVHSSATCILGVVGGQGFLLGRGNQQLSGNVLKRIGAKNLVIVASKEKVTSLQPAKLWIDLDDDSVAEELVGYRRVLVGVDEEVVMELVSTARRRTNVAS